MNLCELFSSASVEFNALKMVLSQPLLDFVAAKEKPAMDWQTIQEEPNPFTQC